MDLFHSRSQKLDLHFREDACEGISRYQQGAARNHEVPDRLAEEHGPAVPASQRQPHTNGRLRDLCRLQDVAVKVHTDQCW